METVEHFGVKLPLDPEIISPLIANLIRKGTYEDREANQIGKLIQPGERILEIGGGIGFISALCAKSPNTQAVRVFEANPNLLPFINGVYALNGVQNAEAFNAILTNDPATPSLDFYLREDFWGSSVFPAAGRYTSAVSVPTRSFRQEIQDFKPSLIICDIEGGELDLFRDADLTGVRRVVVEVHQAVIGGHGIKAIFDAFSALNFHYEQQFSMEAVVTFKSLDS